MPVREVINYTNNDITVVWKPKVCIHSTICWKGLIEVFNPREKPWVKMEGSNTDRIIEQVRKCPSGALSYFLNKEATSAVSSAADQDPEKITGEAAKILRVVVSPQGPYLIENECLIVHSDGRQETKTGTVALCRCGSSANKPYCDGSHNKIGFEKGV